MSFPACEPTDKYVYFKTSAPNDFVIEDATTPADVTFHKDAYQKGNPSKHGWIYRGTGMKNPKQCAVFCASVKNCVAWSSPRYHPGGKATGGCKIFSSKDGKSTDIEYYDTITSEMNNGQKPRNPAFYQSPLHTPLWISGERGCYGK